ncbi:hypothetical protein LguiA_029389 [Lonicera macranthoides]
MDDISRFGYVDVDLEIIVKKRKSDAATSIKGEGKGKGKENIACQVGDTRPESMSEETKAEHISINVKEEDHISLMRKKLSSYKDDFVKPYWGIISKVPEKLRKVNEEAYTPRVVSIGPRHHGAPQLQPMERYKWRCLNRFLERSTLKLESVVQIAMKDEKRVRMLYQDRFEAISSKDFSEMIMLDSVFMIELFIDNKNGLERSPEGEEAKKIFDDPWIERDILHDLMLLENQLPYVILQDMFQAGVPPGSISLHSLIHIYFKNVGFMDKLPEKDWPSTHLVEFLRCCHRPRFVTLRRASRKGKIERTRSAKELQEAGVKFVKPKETGDFLHIEFSAEGVLTIPQLNVNEFTETFFRNLIAFEQCRRHGTQYITSFMILMNSLLSTPKDVDILVDAGVIETSFGDNEQVWEIFSDLRREIAMDNTEFYFAHLCEDLSKYSKDWYHQIKAKWFRSKRILRRDYFSSPWSTISVIVGAILLTLTVIQTAYAIKG